MTAAELVSTMVNRIVEQFHPAVILLFGSQARGDADGSSDVDLLVVMNQISDRHKLAVEIQRHLKEFPISKDIVVATPDDIERLRDVVGTIFYDVVREGKILYEQH